jgi:hypothetical protein
MLPNFFDCMRMLLLSLLLLLALPLLLHRCPRICAPRHGGIIVQNSQVAFLLDSRRRGLAP